MLKKIILMIILMIGSLPPSLCVAQAPQPTPASTVQPTMVPSNEKRQQITMHWETMNGLQFYYLGMPLKSSYDLKRTISPLNDYEANRLLTNSDNENGQGLVFLIGGLALMAGGGAIIGVDPNTKSNPNSIDGQQTIGLVLAVAGLAGDMVGLFKFGDAIADQFNAVQRYNAVVYKNNEVTWNLPKPGIQTELLTLKF